MRLSDGRCFVSLLVFSGMVFGASAHAQTLYRCGNTYQDRPCEGSIPNQVVGKGHALATPEGTSAGAGTGAESVSAADQARCAARGSQAEKIIWSREGGRTLTEALADPSTNGALARDVYQRRGTAAEVRRAVESDCLSDVARAAEAARLNAAAAALTANQRTQGDLDATPGVSAGTASSRAAVGQGGTAPVQSPTRCAQLQAEAQKLTEEQRRGTSEASMRDLDSRLRANFSARRDAGC